MNVADCELANSSIILFRPSHLIKFWRFNVLYVKKSRGEMKRKQI